MNEHIKHFENLYTSRNVFLHNWGSFQLASKNASEIYGPVVSKIKAKDDTGAVRDVDCVWLLNEELLKNFNEEINKDRTNKIETLRTKELIELRVSAFNLVLGLSAYIEALESFIKKHKMVKVLSEFEAEFKTILDLDETKLLLGFRNYIQHYFPVLSTMLFGEKGVLLCVTKSDLPFLASMREGSNNTEFIKYIDSGKTLHIEILATKLTVAIMELLEKMKSKIA